uniref:Uncharacterized protein n=1 Tax=Arundo donax TaxID=35708 RepID=A0A0A9HZ53_ARUDO
MDDDLNTTHKHMNIGIYTVKRSAFGPSDCSLLQQIGFHNVIYGIVAPRTSTGSV